jgi:hypothetical protein
MNNGEDRNGEDRNGEDRNGEDRNRVKQFPGATRWDGHRRKPGNHPAKTLRTAEKKEQVDV